MAQKINIRIIKRKSLKNKVFPSARFLMPKGIFSSILIGLVFAGIFSAVFFAFAVYNPGETIDPTCGPTDSGCTVTPSAVYSFGANNFSGTGSFTTTNTIQGGALTDGTLSITGGNLTTTGTGSFSSLTLTTTALTVGNGGTGLGTIAAGSVLVANTLNTLTAITSTSGTNILTNTNGTISWAVAGTAADSAKLNGQSASYYQTALGASNLLPLNSGGTAANLTASNGGIFYSTATAGAILSGTTTANQLLMSGASTTPAWSTATFPATTTAYQLLVSTATNTVGGLAAGATGQYLSGTTGAVPVWATLNATAVGLGSVTNDAQIAKSIGTAKGDLITFSASATPVHIVAGSSAGNLRTDGSGGWTVDTTAYVSSLTTSTATNLTGFIKGNGSVLSADNSTYLTTAGTAADSAKLNGQSASYYQTALGASNLLPLNSGGTAANLTASNGGIFYSTATAGAILSGTTTANQLLMSGASTTPAWSTATYPATTTANQILYSTADNTISAGAGLTYNGASSGTLTAGTGTEVFTVLSTGQVGIGNTAPTHALDIVSSTLTPQLNVYYDPTHYSSFGADSSGNLTITPSGGNVTIAGTLTVGASNTAGGLATNVVGTTLFGASDSNANGSITVGSDNGGRIYFKYGNNWHYVQETAGFAIPNFETADPISGDQMKEGDIVLGMVNNTFDDKSLHGVWVKWDSVKAELIKEIQAAGGINSAGESGSGEVSGVDTTLLVDKVTNVLTSLGISIKDGVTNITTLATQNFSADTATIKGLQMVDKATGDIYCTWIENGEWQKAKGNCGDMTVASQVAASSQQTTQEIVQQTQQVVQQVQQVVQQSQQAADSAQQSAQTAQQTAQQVSQQVTQQVQQEVTQQLQAQQPQALNINSVAPISDINVDYGTALASANLPTTITATLSDATTQTVTITWDNGTPSYDANTAGTYVFSGTLAFSGNVTNTNNLKVSVNVIVAPQPAPVPEEQPPAPNPAADLIQNAASGLLNGMWNFVKWIFGASLQQSIKFVPEGVKNSSASLSSSVLQSFKSNLSQLSSQIKLAAEMIATPISKLFGK